MTVDIGELVRTLGALVGIIVALMGGFVWLVDSMLGRRLSPMLQAIDAVNHAHAETRRRVETLEGRVDQLRDDKIDHGEVDLRIDLALSRVRSAPPRATD